MVWGVSGRLVSPTGVSPEELVDGTVSEGGSPAAGTASFRVVREWDHGRKGALITSTGLGLGAFTNVLVEFLPAFLSEEGMVLIIP